MLSRVEVGPITEFHGVYSRYVGVVCDNGVILGETLHTKNKEELHIAGDEKDDRTTEIIDRPIEKVWGDCCKGTASMKPKDIYLFGVGVGAGLAVGV